MPVVAEDQVSLEAEEEASRPSAPETHREPAANVVTVHRATDRRDTTRYPVTLKGYSAAAQKQP
jgi:hypothetical protein